MEKDKLNLGCGNDIKKDYVNVDFKKFKGVDLIYDLNKPLWNFKSNTFREVLCYNILEHLDDSFKVFEELHRICKKGAIIKIITPHFSSGNCWGDMQHRRGFSFTSFNHINMKDKFSIVKSKILFSKWRFFIGWFANKFPGFYEYNLAYIFPASDMVVHLKVKK